MLLPSVKAEAAVNEPGGELVVKNSLIELEIAGRRYRWKANVAYVRSGVRYRLREGLVVVERVSFRELQA
jgi:hypothetical protein